MRPLVLGSVGILAAGIALVAWSVAEGGAAVDLVVFVPVVSGSSLAFLAGVLLLIVGFFSLPFTLAAGEYSPSDASGPEGPPSSPPTPSGGLGGFVLIGPVPILFGTWKGVSRRARWLLALVGAVLLTLAIVAVWALVR